MKKKINLVFSGSGTNYFLYVGAYKAIHEKYIATGEYEIGEVVGTSGGALIAALIASGHDDPSKLHQLTVLSLPRKYIDWSWLPFRTYGLIKGKKLRNKFKEMLVSTLGETKHILTITGTNVDLGSSDVFSTISTPDLNLSDAVYASMCYPIVFAPIEINGYKYIDGGVTNNFPLDLVIKDQDLTIGVSSSNPHEFHKPVKTLYQYLFRIVDIFMRELTLEKIEESTAQQIHLSGEGSSMDLMMKEDKAIRLINKGYLETKGKL